MDTRQSLSGPVQSTPSASNKDQAGSQQTRNNAESDALESLFLDPSTLASKVSSRSMILLQKAIGNRAVGRLLSQLQSKADEYEAPLPKPNVIPTETIQESHDPGSRLVASPAATQNGVTTFFESAMDKPYSADIAAHEEIHRDQFAAYFQGKAPGTPQQLELEAEERSFDVSSGKSYEPQYAAPPQLSLTYTLEEMQGRLALIEQGIARLERRSDNQPNNQRQLQSARLALNQFRSRLGSNDPNLEHQLETAENITERVERAMAALGQRRAEVIRTETNPDRREAYVRQIDYVRDDYLAAVLQMFIEPDAERDFDLAEAAAQDLPYQMLNTDLARLMNHAGSRSGGITQDIRNEQIAWVEWFRGRASSLNGLAEAYAQARTQGGQVERQARERLEREGQLLELSVRGMAQLDQIITAAEYYGDQHSADLVIFHAITQLARRCRDLQALALQENVSELQTRITSIENDPAVAQFYRALPAMLGVSQVVTQLGIALTATLVTAGVGSAVFGALRGTAATVGVGRMALAIGGTAVIEGIVFTGVNTGLDAALLGRRPTAGQLLQDLAWNIGLFGVLRTVSLGVGAGLHRFNLEPLRIPVGMGTSYPFLHGYGLLRFRLEQGRMPTDQEMSQMTAQNLLMLFAISAGAAMVGRWLPGAGRQSSMMRYFREQYELEVEGLETARESLLGQIAREIQAGNGANPQVHAQLQSRAQVVEQRFAQLMARLHADPRIDLNAIRAELTQSRNIIIEGSQQLLQEALGVGEEVALRATGSGRSYTYRSAGTNRLVERLRTVGLYTQVTRDPLNGRRTVTATEGPQGENPITFQERSDPPYGPREVNIDIQDPSAQQLFTRLGIGPDPALRRMIIYLMEAQLSRQPRQSVQWAADQVNRIIRTRIRQNSGQTVDQVVRDIRERGWEQSQPGVNPQAVVLARELAGHGFLRSEEWLNARNNEQQRGAVGEWFGQRETQRTLQPGTRLLRNIYFIGTRFRNAALTQPERVRTTIAEADLITIRETPTGTEAVEVSNIKAATGQGGQAGSQNDLAIRAIEANQTGRPMQIVENGVTFWAVILRIEGVEVGTGTRIDLTGNIRQSRGGTSRQTMGPRGAQGYTQSLPYDVRTMDQIVTLLREMQFMQTPGY